MNIPHSHKLIPPAQIRLSEIKSHLTETLCQQIKASGFSFNKSSFEFKKKNRGNYVRLFFLFYDYYPLNYRISFHIVCKNEKLQEIKTHLSKKDPATDFAVSSLGFSLGDFVDEVSIDRNVNERDLFVFKIA